MTEPTGPVTIKAAPDRRARHPDGRLLDPAGEAVVIGSYWQRRLDDGDVVVVPARPVTRKPLDKDAS